MPAIPSNKPYRVGRSRTGLGLFATKPIKKGTKIIRYFGPLLDSKKKKDDAIENKYLFELNDRWTIDGSVRKNIARYINHACKPNAESDVKPRKRKVFIRAIKNIEPGEEINYDYGTDYFKAYLKPIGCKCAACEKKRKKKRAEARAERLRLKQGGAEGRARRRRKKAEKLKREGRTGKRRPANAQCKGQGVQWPQRKVVQANRTLANGNLRNSCGIARASAEARHARKPSACNRRASRDFGNALSKVEPSVAGSRRTRRQQAKPPMLGEERQRCRPRSASTPRSETLVILPARISS